MLIVFESPDGSGKTWLASRIQEAEGGKLIHKGPPGTDRHILDEYVGDIAWYRPGEGENAFLDRWHLGETIYGPKYRGESRLSRGQFLFTELVLDRLGALRVTLGTPVPVMAERLSERGEEPDTDDLQHARDNYWLFNRSTNNPAWMWVEEYDEPELIAWLPRVAASLERNLAPIKDLRTYVGPAKPDALLVGDVQAPWGEVLPHQFAFPPYEKSSGYFLFEALAPAVDNRQISFGVINANGIDSIREAWESLDRPVVIALGREANRTLHSAGIEYRPNHHPQYIRRFRHDKMAVYGLTLANQMDPDLGHKTYPIT